MPIELLVSLYELVESYRSESEIMLLIIIDESLSHSLQSCLMSFAIGRRSKTHPAKYSLTHQKAVRLCATSCLSTSELITLEIISLWLTITSSSIVL
jgi:hypothetical protein